MSEGELYKKIQAIEDSDYEGFSKEYYNELLNAKAVFKVLDEAKQDLLSDAERWVKIEESGTAENFTVTNKGYYYVIPVEKFEKWFGDKEDESSKV